MNSRPHRYPSSKSRRGPSSISKAPPSASTLASRIGCCHVIRQRSKPQSVRPPRPDESRIDGPIDVGMRDIAQKSVDFGPRRIQENESALGQIVTEESRIRGREDRSPGRQYQAAHT